MRLLFLILTAFTLGIQLQGAATKPLNVVLLYADDRRFDTLGCALNVDLAPTILAVTGIKAPATMQGRDLAPLYLAAEKPAWRTEFFYEHAIIKSKDFIPASEALVRKDWKYFYWPDFGLEQLFHVAADPFEENDVAHDPTQAARLAEMRTRFAELKAAAR